ncbi:MAG: Do family serine endopeptidase [Deltaproteobacteria bacterium]|nr:Do family serine endopeptidase [Deltaproteobacteria bacterium]
MRTRDLFLGGIAVVGSVFLSGSIAFAKPDKLWIDSTEAPSSNQLALPSFAPIIEKLSLAVVNISTEGKDDNAPALPRRRDRFGLPDQDKLPQGPGQRSPFDFFFQVPPEQRRMPVSGSGSGFVIHPEGYIVTNFHLVERASKINVAFKDQKKTHVAKVVGSDRKTDLALLKIEAGNPLSFVTLGDSERAKPGDWVIAIGNPFNLGHTATVGIVSAKSRRFERGGPYDDYIQTDASINPGNSGGPLFNAQGDVIGVNSAIYSPGVLGSSGFNIGIGFAIPINLARDILSELYEKGKVTRGWLGVLIQPLTEDLAEAFKLSTSDGALVGDVMKDSPAERVGIKPGDVIVSFNGKPVKENDQLPLMVARTPIGSDVEVGVIRKGKTQTFKVKIDELKDGDDDGEDAPGPEENKLGLSVQDLTPDIARSLGIDESSGVVVSNVEPGSVADSEGIRRGDVILEVNSQAVEDAAGFQSATKNLNVKKPVLLLLSREGNTLYVTLRPDESAD